MPDREKVIGHLNDCMEASRRDNTWVFVRKDIVEDVIALLKEQESLLGIQQTANSITFVSTGTAQQGEERGEEDEPVYTVKPDDEACNRFELNLTKEEHNDQG